MQTQKWDIIESIRTYKDLLTTQKPHRCITKQALINTKPSGIIILVTFEFTIVEKYAIS